MPRQTETGAYARSTLPGKTGTGRAGRRPIPYDFRRPDKFSKDHIRSIQSIHETFDRYASNYLAAQVRSAVHIELERLEQMTLGDYLDQTPSQTVLGLAEPEPLVGRFLLEIDHGIASRVIDRMLGGAGEERPPFANTGWTEIELSLLRDLGNGLFRELANAWDQVIKLNPSPVEIVLSPQQLQGILPSEIILLVRHTVRLFDGEGSLSVILPASTLEPIMPRLNARILFANPRRTTSDAETRADVIGQLMEVPLTVRVEIGRTTLTVAELLALTVGDVVVLQAPVDHPLPVLVEEVPCFQGFPGRKGRALAVRIAGLADEAWPEEPTLDEEGGRMLWPTIAAG